VDHPRYLCNQCHVDDDLAAQPYSQNCTVEIHYDYGWANEWYVAYGYYPVYYYPTFYYVDPWTWRPWVNYWYRPYYYWPAVPFYTWGYSCYSWNYSPYYCGDVVDHYRSGNRRYRPLDKTLMGRERAGDVRTRTRNDLVQRGEPEARTVTAMRERTRLEKGELRNRSRDEVRRGEADGRRYVNKGPVTRDRRQGFDGSERVADRSGGLRIQDRSRVDSGFRHGISGEPISGREVRSRAESQERAARATRDARTSSGHRARSDAGEQRIGTDRTLRSRSEVDRTRSSRPSIKTVEPRRSTRVWSGRRSSSGNERTSDPTRVEPQRRGSGSRSGSAVDRTPSRNSGRTQPRVAPQRGSSGSSRGSGRSQPEVRSRSGGSRSSGSKQSGVRSSGNSGRQSAPSRPSSPPQRRSSGGGRSRSGGGR
jgi:hypothetical protein